MIEHHDKSNFIKINDASYKYVQVVIKLMQNLKTVDKVCWDPNNYNVHYIYLLHSYNREA